jgi:hypothetical protein
VRIERTEMIEGHAFLTPLRTFRRICEEEQKVKNERKEEVSYVSRQLRSWIRNTDVVGGRIGGFEDQVLNVE